MAKRTKKQTTGPMICGKPVDTALLEHHVAAVPPGTRVQWHNGDRWRVGEVVEVHVIWRFDGRQTWFDVRSRDGEVRRCRPANVRMARKRTRKAVKR